MIRYDPDRDGAMDPWEDGDWVRYEDAQELQRQLDEERARLDYLVDLKLYGNTLREWLQAGSPSDIGKSGAAMRQAIDRERIKGAKT